MSEIRAGVRRDFEPEPFKPEKELFKTQVSIVFHDIGVSIGAVDGEERTVQHLYLLAARRLLGQVVL